MIKSPYLLDNITTRDLEVGFKEFKKKWNADGAMILIIKDNKISYKYEMDEKHLEEFIDILKDNLEED